MSPVVTRDSWADAQGRRWTSRFRLLGESPAPRVLEIPDFMQAYERKLLIPTLHEASVAQDWPAIRDASPDGQPAFSSELSMGFFSDRLMRAVIAIDLRDGSEVGRLEAPTRTSGVFWSHYAFNDARKLLLVPVMQGGILIRDVAAKAWIGVLNTPEGTYAPAPSFSADGTHVCAMVQRNVASSVSAKTVPTTEAVVWNISELVKGRGVGSR